MLRYLTSVLAAHWLGEQFPYGTLIVNLVGSFAIGLVHQVGSDTLLIPDNLRLFLTTGIMGGLTTYSAFSYETARFMRPVPGRKRGSISPSPRRSRSACACWAWQRAAF